MKITAVLTCHNRCAKTRECLFSLYNQCVPPEVTIDAVVVDDGSTDGTSEMVATNFPGARVLTGNGNFFWCGGMRAGWKEAATQDPDYFLLLNDDTILDSDAVRELLELAGSPETRRIAVAAIRDPDSGLRTYGGVRGSGAAVPVGGTAEPCDTFNANAVLVPRAAYREIGMFHPAYTHALGDFDYGYDATRRGMEVFQTRKMIGSCKRNSLKGTWYDRSLSRRERFRRLQSPKGLPWREWVVFNRRNAGWIWPWRCISPFLRILLGR